MKSPATEQALSHVKRLQAESVESFEVDKEKFSLEAKAAKLEDENAQKRARKAIGDGEDREEVLNILACDSPDEPTLRRHITNDVTPASLAELLRQNENGLLVYRDELCSLLMSLDREDMSDARGLFLSGWNGNSAYTCDRIGRGLNLHVKATCISLIGSTQPGRISEYIRRAVSGGLGDDGLIQRFSLMVWPDSQGTWKDVDVSPDENAKRTAYEAFRRLNQIDLNAVDAQVDEHDGLPYLRFDEGALEQFIEWRTKLENLLGSASIHPALEAHFSKFKKAIPSIALIIHLADGGVGPVSSGAMFKALEWDYYLRHHAERIYFAGLNTDAQAAQTILTKVRSGKLDQHFTRRDVNQKNWGGLTDLKQVESALELLTEYDWLRCEVLATGGRPSTRYSISPKALT